MERGLYQETVAVSVRLFRTPVTLKLGQGYPNSSLSVSLCLSLSLCLSVSLSLSLSLSIFSINSSISKQRGIKEVHAVFVCLSVCLFVCMLSEFIHVKNIES